MSAPLRTYFGRAAVAALIIMVGFILGGIYSLGVKTGPLKGALVFAVIALVVDRLISTANRKKIKKG